MDERRARGALSAPTSDALRRGGRRALGAAGERRREPCAKAPARAWRGARLARAPPPSRRRPADRCRRAPPRLETAGATPRSAPGRRRGGGAPRPWMPRPQFAVRRAADGAPRAAGRCRRRRRRRARRRRHRARRRRRPAPLGEVVGRLEASVGRRCARSAVGKSGGPPSRWKDARASGRLAPRPPPPSRAAATPPVRGGRSAARCERCIPFRGVALRGGIALGDGGARRRGAAAGRGGPRQGSAAGCRRAANRGSGPARGRPHAAPCPSRRTAARSRRCRRRSERARAPSSGAAPAAGAPRRPLTAPSAAATALDATAAPSLVDHWSARCTDARAARERGAGLAAARRRCARGGVALPSRRSARGARRGGILGRRDHGVNPTRSRLRADHRGNRRPQRGPRRRMHTATPRRCLRHRCRHRARIAERRG